MSRPCRVIKYVKHSEVLDHLRVGWMVLADLGSYHGQFSLLMGWQCACALVVPVPEKEGNPCA
jgi:hypothetical protein